MSTLALSSPNKHAQAAGSTHARSLGLAQLRPAVQALVLSAIVAMVANTWLLSGALVPTVVTGSSMAPTLMGAHLRWNCTGCGHAFACDAESLPTAGRDAVCPRCGEANEVASGKAAGGQRVFADRTAYAWRAPRRWEAVMLRAPDESARLCVKRVIGLPGEEVELQDGDVLIDGQRTRKPVHEQRTMAIAVAEADDAAERWTSERAGAWSFENGRWSHTPGTVGRVDWLVYRHTEPTTAGGAAESPILDGSPTNQAESRQLNKVSDVVLRCKLHGKSGDRCFITVRSRGDELRLIVPLAGGAARLSHNGNRVRGGRVASGHAESLAVEVIVSDGQLVFSAAGKPVLEYTFEPTPREKAEGPRVAIGADEAALSVSDIEVLRDVHYTPGPGGQTRYRLGPDEYFVLGDHSAHSLDSRQWLQDGCAVRAALLLGPVLSW